MLHFVKKGFGMKKKLLLAVLLVAPMSILFARNESTLPGTQSVQIGEDESAVRFKPEIPRREGIGFQKAPSGEDKSQSRLLTPTTKIRQDKSIGTLSEALTDKPPYMLGDKSRDATGYITTGGVLGTQSYTTGASMSPQSYTAGDELGTQGYTPKDEVLPEGVLP